MEEFRNNVALYAAIKTLHGDGHDMWSAVASLTLLTIPDNGSDDEIKRSFTQQYKIDVPTDALKTVLSRLKKSGLIEHESGYSTITKAGKDYRAELESSVLAVRREYRQLTDGFKEYLKKNGITPPAEIDKALFDFIDDNIGVASEIMTSKQQKKSSIIPSSAIAGFIVHIEKSDPSLFEILQNIFFGRLYLTLIQTRAQLDTAAKFDKLTIYLDTNIIFSLLGLHEDAAVSSAKELLEVFKEYSAGINIAVWDVTVDEALQYLNAFAHDESEYVEHLKVDSTHYRMKVKNIDKQDIILLIENFDKALEELGINVDVSPSTSKEEIDETASAIRKHVFNLDMEKNPKAVTHDATVVECVKKKRGRTYTQLLEKSRAVFVTPDQSIIAYAREHVGSGNAFPLAVRPIEMISLLWVKALGENGKFSGALLRNAVMGYARERLISQKLWDKFVARLEDAQKKGSITKEDVGIILAADETEKMLSSNKDDVVSKIIDPDYVNKIRKQQETLRLKGVNDAQAIRFLNDKLSDKQVEIEDVEEQSKAAEAELDAIDSKLLRIMHGLAVTIVTVLGLVIVAALLVLMWWLLNTIGLSDLASWLTLAGIAVIGFFVFVIGREFRPAQFILTIRIKTIEKIKKKFFNNIKSFLTKRANSPKR